jgi:hypothetical protein
MGSATLFFFTLWAQLDLPTLFSYHFSLPFETVLLSELVSSQLVTSELVNGHFMDRGRTYLVFLTLLNDAHDQILARVAMSSRSVGDTRTSNTDVRVFMIRSAPPAPAVDDDRT